MIHHKYGSVPARLAGFYPDDIGGLLRHMAPRTVVDDKGKISVVGVCTKIMFFGGMASLTAPGIVGVVVVAAGMRVMAGRTVHIAHPKTFAGSQQGHLVAMYVGLLGADMGIDGVMGQRIAGPETEYRSEGDVVTSCVTGSAKIDLPVAGKGPPGYDIPGMFVRGVFRMVGHVVGRGAMASLAIDLGDERSPAKGVYIVRIGWGDIGGVAFKTSFQYRPVEKGQTGGVSRAGCPAIKGIDPGNRELVELVVLPVEVGLSFRIAEYDVETLCPILFSMDIKRLVGDACAVLHDDVGGVVDHEGIGVVGEAARDGGQGSDGGRVVMRRAAVGFDDRPVTG